jgi:hypothetical protein
VRDAPAESEANMENLGYILIGSVFILWILGMIAGMVAIYPFGLIGLIVLTGFGLLFSKVAKERMANKEDDYYNDNVNQ